MTTTLQLTARRVLVPGGTGGVGEGVVRHFLAAGAQVVVPTRSTRRAEEFRAVLGNAATGNLHLFEHDYTTFAGAESLAGEVESRLGGVDDVVAPIGGWWAGRRLWEIDQADWDSAFTGLATAHMAVLRAALPRLGAEGAYTVVTGESSSWPVPGSGLVSMEQAALLMMQRVAAAELGDRTRVFAFVLGPVATRGSDSPDPSWVTSEQVGAAAVAVSARSDLPGQTIELHDAEGADAVLQRLGADTPARTWRS
ncbi:SDR family oxidoreductase [Jatrophihabitans sp. YIM 134969]